MIKLLSSSPARVFFKEIHLMPVSNVIIGALDAINAALATRVRSQEVAYLSTRHRQQFPSINILIVILGNVQGERVSLNYLNYFSVSSMSNFLFLNLQIDSVSSWVK